MKGLTEMTLSQMREAMVCGDVSSRELTGKLASGP